MIGLLGDIIFTVSDKKILTLSDLKREGSSRWAKHDVLLKKPIKQFVGEDLEKYSLKIELDVFLGVNPIEQLKLLRQYRDKGNAINFIVGELNKMVTLESLSEEMKIIDNNGNILKVAVEINLEEFDNTDNVKYKVVKGVVKSVSSSTKKSSSSSSSKKSSTSKKTSKKSSSKKKTVKKKNTKKKKASAAEKKKQEWSKFLKP